MEVTEGATFGHYQQEEAIIPLEYQSLITHKK